MANLQKLTQLVQEYLEYDEKILHSVYGCYETKSLGQKTIRNGAFFATDIRLLFYSKRTFGFDMEVFPYEKISSLEMSKGALGYRVRFCTSGNEVQIKFINSGDVKTFTSYVRSMMGGSRSSNLVRESSSIEGLKTLEQPKMDLPLSEPAMLDVKPTGTDQLPSVKNTPLKSKPNQLTLRLLRFIGWGISGFLLLGLLAGITSNPVSTTLSVSVWLLVFLPPIYRFTYQYGLFWNIFGRTALFLLPPILLAGIMAPQQPNQIPQNPTPINQTSPPKTSATLSGQASTALTTPERRETSRAIQSGNLNEAYISASDMGEEWPLLVSEGRLRCDPPKIVSFTTPNGIKYGVNGTAKSAGLQEIDAIWKDSNEPYIPKVNIGPLIQRGLLLCQD